MIPDTTFLIDIMSKDAGAINKLKEITSENKTLFVTTPSLFEIWSGIVRSDKPENEKIKISVILKAQPVLSLDWESAQEGGKIYGNLIMKGMMIESIDAMIAGIAKRHNEKILTRNKKHFEKIENLQIETY